MNVDDACTHHRNYFSVTERGVQLYISIIFKTKKFRYFQHKSAVEFTTVAFPLRNLKWKSVMRPSSPNLFSSDREESTEFNFFFSFSQIFFKTILPIYTKYLYKKILINRTIIFHKFFENIFGKIPDLRSKISNLIYHNFNLASVIIDILIF